jgi:hypothetical protein
MSSRNKQRLVIVVSAVWAVFLITVGLSPKAQDKIHTGWHNWKSGASSTLRIEPVQAGKTVIFERFVHDGECQSMVRAERDGRKSVLDSAIIIMECSIIRPE